MNFIIIMLSNNIGQKRKMKSYNYSLTKVFSRNLSILDVLKKIYDNSHEAKEAGKTHFM